MKKPGPLVQMTLALVGLCGTLVLLADLFFGVMPDREAHAMQLRKRVGEALAVQVATLLQSGDRALLQRTLEGVEARTEGVRSLAVRLADGSIVLQAGDHARHWRAASTEASTADQVIVPLNAGGARWGSFEIAFAATGREPIAEFLSHPLVVTLMFISIGGTLAFGLYMRRALQHLDPSSVIPARVQGAFDAMAEGVVVLDARGRVLLANKAFRALHRACAEVGAGQRLSALAWLGDALPSDPGEHPWAKATAERKTLSGHALELGGGGADARRLIINCAPVTDPGGQVRGCLVTFDDVSELHRSNEALREAMAALTASKEEVLRQNVELERLATRDPLTGCLNRRSFYLAFDKLLADALANNTALSCLMVDIDHFKAVNDTHGHAVGDRVIQEVAKKLHDSARATDLVGRYGGEEFCIVVPGLPPADVAAFAERLRGRIEHECGPGVREVPGMRVTGSLGVATLTRDVSAAPMLVDRADQALYQAKRSGRNRVCEFRPEPVGAEQAVAA